MTPSFFQREIITKKGIYLDDLKKMFSRATWPISTKLGTNHPLVKGILVCSNEGPLYLSRGDGYEIVKIH